MYEVFGRRVFAVTDGPPTAEPILVLHGFPTCSYDYARALPVLAARHRVVLHDHLGFGLSEKPAEFGYSLFGQAEIAAGLWRSMGIKRGHLVAHDYGTSVATELLALRQRGLLPMEIASVTLSNGSVLVELAHLRVAQRILRNQMFGKYLARLSSETFFKRQIRGILAKPEAATDAELAALFEALIHDDGRERLSQISQYIDERTRFRDRWFNALTTSDVPLHLLWAKLDPIAVPAIPEKIFASVTGQNARLTWIDDLGHYPMLEDATRWAELAVRGIENMSAS
jgi:pimeloyl-ACP methyl ester carboxylesterase